MFNYWRVKSQGAASLMRSRLLVTGRNYQTFFRCAEKNLLPETFPEYIFKNKTASQKAARLILMEDKYDLQICA
jgi:hypothetical protein